LCSSLFPQPTSSSQFSIRKASEEAEEASDDESKKDKMEDQKKHKNDGNLWGGLILIALGVIFLIDRFVPNIDFGDLWPLILVVVGVILISKSIQRK